MEKEIWKEIFNGEYKISNYGRCISYKVYSTGKLLTPMLCTAGYYQYQLRIDGHRKVYMAHVLVAEAFVPNPYGKIEVNHKDECKTNNYFENLEWVTPKENCNYGTRNLRMAQSKGKPVIQLDLKGNFIKRWDYATLAANNLGINPTGIMRVCKGKQKTCMGYKWIYEKDYAEKVA